jgi:hypothetical protein
VLEAEVEILAQRVSKLEVASALHEIPLRTETLESTSATLRYKPPMSPEEGSLIDQIRELTGVPPIIEETGVTYVYINRDAQWAVRSVPRVGATRLLDTLRQAIRSCRLDHNESLQGTRP